MPGYGYGEAGGRRRARSASSNHSSSPVQEKRPKSGKKAKGKKRKKGYSEVVKRDRDQADKKEVAATAPAPLETAERAQLPAAAGPTATSGMDTIASRGAWREEIDSGRACDGATGGVVDDGFEQEESDEEAVERKLAESRARREALIAKWVNRGESATDLPDMSTPLIEEEEADSDGEVARFFEEQRRKREAREGAEEESLENKRAVNRFILQQKAEHDGDMFDENPEDQEALKVGVNQSAAISQTGASAHDWNDQEGYYRAQIGELMGGRYRVVENMCGKGVFSNVVKARDDVDKTMYAIKVMRCNDMMRKAAEKEIEVLQRLNRADKTNKKNVIRLVTTFDYRDHMCLVFECMWDNLRVALKKYTKDKGMSMRAVRAYTKQLLVAMRHIHRCGVIHADIKPDNILISAGHNLVKICDLGSAIELSEVEQTPYLVSRFYRAPEIVLGAKYGPPADVFALGASLFELFCGKILFPGKSNNDMLKLFMDLKGKLPHKMIKSGLTSVWKQHFDDNMDFKYVDRNKLTKKSMIRTITDCSAKKSMLDLVMQRVGPEKQKSSDPEDQTYIKKAKQFADLLNQMTTLDPEKRGVPEELLKHPFVAEAWPAPKPVKDAKAPAQA